MLLSELFDNTPAIEIKQLSIDSRVPMKDCIFFCLSGIRDDGHDFINEAINNGANVIVYKDEINISQKAIYIRVSNVADCLNHIAAKFYEYPSSKLESYIIGGCNGNTSISYILSKLINNFKKVGSIGMNGIYYDDHHLLNNVPTLTILDNQKYLNEFVKKHVEVCILEANAMALAYKKLDSINPNLFIYTNTNEYSSDYEEIGNDYFDVFRRYLYTLDDHNIVLLNHDDISYEEFHKACGKNCFSYGFNNDSDYQILNVNLTKKGSTFSLKHKADIYKFTTKFLGTINVYNLAAALSALDIMHYDLNLINPLLEQLNPLSGIMYPIDLGQNYNVIIDCAQDYANVKAVIDYSYKITPRNRKIVVVWGLDSTTDENSLKEILELAKDYTAHLIITERNTYKGNVFFDLKKTIFSDSDFIPLIIEDRPVAIESAIELLNKDDTLLILGKGNEKYIVRNMGKQEYEGDKDIAIRLLKKRLKEEKELF